MKQPIIKRTHVGSDAHHREHLVFMLIGVTQIIDGLLLILTLGFYASNLTLHLTARLARWRYSRRHTRI